MVPYLLESRLVREMGISAAAVYDQLYDLCREKERKNADYHDGYFWVRIPYSDFPRVFPYLSDGTVFKALRKLRDKGLVIVDHFDETGIHRKRGSSANWYALTQSTSACRPENVLE